ncbi:MAG: DNA-3-methyladenine glycosylase [Oligoflexia bacterium]|nr:DNA-3-methyladenine glycosylase [Oligoflexia bacterium]
MAKSSIGLSEKSSAADSLPPISLSFYARPTRVVARELIGKVLISKSRGVTTFGRIVETEAYTGSGDPAAHCYAGKTPRSSVMFGAPGRAYVYFIYGMYEMLNFVTEPDGTAGAVLIRALEPLGGIAAMKRRRGAARSERDLCNGPGKLCRAFGIPMSWNKKPLDSRELRVVDDGYRFDHLKSLRVSPRVGISQGLEHYWRYFSAESPFVSRVSENRLARAPQLHRGEV